MHFELGVYWMKKAAERGYSGFGLFAKLGVIYLFGGEGVNPDEKEALLWIDKAMTVNSEVYQHIGKSYYRGNFERFVPGLKAKVNYEKALQFLLKAIEKNPEDHSSHIAIVNIYFRGGHGVERDYKKALLYVEMIPPDGRLSVIPLMVMIYGRGGDGVIKDLDKAFELCTKSLFKLSLQEGQLHQFSIYPPDYEKALRCYEACLNSWEREATVRIGMMYLKGLGVKKNLTTACSYFSESSSPYWEGFVLSSGISGIDIDYKSIFKLYGGVSSDDEYFGQAMNAIGKLYQDGLGVEQSYTKAKEHFILGIENGCSEAYNSMGDMYKHGFGVEIDYHKAFELYAKAAEEPFDNGGQFNLGMMYIEGKGTEVDYRRASYWFERAHTFGNEQANSSFITLTKILASHCIHPPIQYSPGRLQFFHVEHNQQQNIANASEQGNR